MNARPWRVEHSRKLQLGTQRLLRSVGTGGRGGGAFRTSGRRSTQTGGVGHKWEASDTGGVRLKGEAFGTRDRRSTQTGGVLHKAGRGVLVQAAGVRHKRGEFDKNRRRKNGHVCKRQTPFKSTSGQGQAITEVLTPCLVLYFTTVINKNHSILILSYRNKPIYPVLRTGKS